MAYRGGRGRASGRGGSGFRTRVNGSGYKQYRTSGGAWKFTHIRVAEKKVGGPIGPGREVHHQNGDKRDNRPSNLRVLPAAVHRLIHRKGK